MPPFGHPHPTSRYETLEDVLWLSMSDQHNPCNRGDIERGAEFIEPAYVEHPCNTDIFIGMAGFIAGYTMRSCSLNAYQTAGWVQELNDHDEVTIALRRAAARGC